MKNRKGIKLNNVTDLMQLDDENLVPELQKRIQDGNFCFIFSEEFKNRIIGLSIAKGQELKAEDIEPLWQLLIEDAITYLKMADSREWSKQYTKPRSEEHRSNLKAFGVDKVRFSD